MVKRGANKTQKKVTQKEGVKDMTVTGATGAGQTGEGSTAEDLNDMSPIKDGTEVEIKEEVVRVEELSNGPRENPAPASGMEVLLRQEIEELKAQLETYQTANAKTGVIVDPEPPAPKSHHCTCPDCGGPMAKGK